MVASSQRVIAAIAEQIVVLGLRAASDDVVVIGAADRQGRTASSQEFHRPVFDLVGVVSGNVNGHSPGVFFQRQSVTQFLQQGSLEAAQVGFLKPVGKAAQGFSIYREQSCVGVFTRQQTHQQVVELVGAKQRLAGQQ